MAAVGKAVKLPYPYPDLLSGQWDPEALWRNLNFLASKISYLQAGQLVPSGGILMMRSGSTCPDGYTKITDSGLAGRFLRVNLSSGGGTGGTTLATVVSAGAHSHTNTAPSSTILVDGNLDGTTVRVSTGTHIHTISSSGSHTHHVPIQPLYLDIILCQKD